VLAIRKFLVILWTVITIIVSLNHAKHGLELIRNLFLTTNVSQTHSTGLDEKSVAPYDNDETLKKTNEIMEKENNNKNNDVVSTSNVGELSTFNKTKDFLAKLL
jgi:hypothetical protein